AYLDVERKIHVAEVPESMRSRSTDKFVLSAERLGIPMMPLRQNTQKYVDNARCNFGCPSRTKMSIDVSYLPSALAHGARIVSDALVKRVMIEHGRAVGVEGQLLERADGGPGARFRVRAGTVVVACGTLHTPVLLMKSGLGKGATALGRNVTLHPAVRLSA